MLVALSGAIRAYALPETQTLPIRHVNGSSIVVRGTVNDTYPVDMLLDTGTTVSIVSPRLCRRVGCRTLAVRAPVISITGQRERYPLAVVPSIGLGPIRRPLTCPMGELPLPGVDIMIGRDVLRNIAFILDLQQSVIHFGAEAGFRFKVSFDPSRINIILPIKIGNRTIPVLLDTGAGALCLFRNRVGGWLQTNGLELRHRIRHLSGDSVGIQVRLRDVQLGNGLFDSMNAIVLESIARETSAFEWAGLLGLRSLNPRRVLFDFRKGIFSWE
jgi:predicted aspartyl protease